MADLNGLGGCTVVTGDIRDRDICGHNYNFQALEKLSLPSTVHGGEFYEFQNVSEEPSFMQAIHLLLQRSPTLFESDMLSIAFYWRPW
jgi:hypothetical protein